MPDDKWKLSYDYSRKRLDEDIERFQLIDSKSEKFLTLVSAVFAIVATVSAWAFQNLMPPTGLLTWMLFLTIVATFICLVSCWSFLFRATKLIEVPRMPLSDEVIQLFWNNDITNVYYALTKACKVVLDGNREIIRMKVKLIIKAYKEISIAAILVAIDVALIVAINFMK